MADDTSCVLLLPYCSVPPAKVMLPVPNADALKFSVPPESVVPPAYVLTPLRYCAPLPVLSSASPPLGPPLGVLFWIVPEKLPLALPLPRVRTDVP